jgi:processive 1,2-diacylglycerol beta-glucosyltransferase
LGAAREVRHVDTLNYTNKLFRHLYAKAYLDLVQNAPAALGWLYDHLDRPWRNERRRLALDRLNTRPFVRLLRDYRPDITVCTHFLPAEIISWLKAKERLRNPQAIVVTDMDVHAMWLCHHYEQYFVALEETRVHLVQLGVPADRMKTVSYGKEVPLCTESNEDCWARNRRAVGRADTGAGPTSSLESLERQAAR